METDTFFQDALKLAFQKNSIFFIASLSINGYTFKVSLLIIWSNYYTLYWVILICVYYMVRIRVWLRVT